MNRLQYLLTKLAEEANEVGQIALKTSQFGMDEIKPGQDHPHTNADRIKSELTDLLVIVELLNSEFNLGFDYTKPDPYQVASRIAKIEHYHGYSVKLGMVKE